MAYLTKMWRNALHLYGRMSHSVESSVFVMDMNWNWTRSPTSAKAVTSFSFGAIGFHSRRRRHLPGKGMSLRHLASIRTPWRSTTKQGKSIRTIPILCIKAACACLNSEPTPKHEKRSREVERLAPGWFRCRSDRWLADGLETGTISNEEFMLVRTLDDGGLDAAQATSLARQGIERFPEFAPLYLFLGDRCGDETEAIGAYRKGLELVEEPDLESRLLCALAGRLPVESPERRELVERAVKLKGSLVALATARLMGLQ